MFSGLEALRQRFGSRMTRKVVRLLAERTMALLSHSNGILREGRHADFDVHDIAILSHIDIASKVGVGNS